MLPLRTLEYLFYIGMFILLFKFSEAASFGAIEDSTVPTPTVSTSSKREAMKRAFGECDSGFSWICLKIEFVKLMERLAEQDELNPFPGVSVVKDVNASETRTAELMAEVARSYPKDPNSRLNGYILTKMSNFLQTRFLRLKLIDGKTVNEARSAVETGRKGKFGKKGGMEALLAAGLMMKGMLMAIGMGAIALLAGKALITALLALTLSSVIGLKALASGGGKSTTYEIVAKPVYTSSHSHSVSHDEGHGHGGGSGWGGYSRSLDLNVINHLQPTPNKQ